MSVLWWYLLGVATPFAVVLAWWSVMLVKHVLWVRGVVYVLTWMDDRNYRLVKLSQEGNAIAVTPPWRRNKALVVRFWPKPLRQKPPTERPTPSARNAASEEN